MVGGMVAAVARQPRQATRGASAGVETKGGSTGGAAGAGVGGFSGAGDALGPGGPSAVNDALSPGGAPIDTSSLGPNAPGMGPTTATGPGVGPGFNTAAFDPATFAPTAPADPLAPGPPQATPADLDQLANPGRGDQPPGMAPGTPSALPTSAQPSPT